jgi:hypothetical protein
MIFMLPWRPGRFRRAKAAPLPLWGWGAAGCLGLGVVVGVVLVVFGLLG